MDTTDMPSPADDGALPGPSIASNVPRTRTTCSSWSRAACPKCHGKGALVFVYGPAASGDDTDALAGLDLDNVTDPIAATS